VILVNNPVLFFFGELINRVPKSTRNQFRSSRPVIVQKMKALGLIAREPAPLRKQIVEVTTYFSAC
jgi:hypothetical protein